MDRVVGTGDAKSCGVRICLPQCLQHPRGAVINPMSFCAHEAGAGLAVSCPGSPGGCRVRTWDELSEGDNPQGRLAGSKGVAIRMDREGHFPEGLAPGRPLGGGGQGALAGSLADAVHSS